MKTYKVTFRCWVQVEAENEDEALEIALDELANAYVTDHTEEVVENENDQMP